MGLDIEERLTLKSGLNYSEVLFCFLQPQKKLEDSQLQRKGENEGNEPKVLYFLFKAS